MRGQRDREHAALPHLALDGERALLCFDQGFGDRQAQPQPRLAGGLIATIVALKESREAVGSDSRALSREGWAIIRPAIRPISSMATAAALPVPDVWIHLLLDLILRMNSNDFT